MDDPKLDGPRKWTILKFKNGQVLRAKTEWSFGLKVDSPKRKMDAKFIQITVHYDL